MKLKIKNCIQKNKNKKILFVASNLGLGGAERQLTSLIEIFSKKYQIYLILISDNGKDFYKLNKKKVKIFRFKKKNTIKIFHYISIIYKIRKLIKFVQPHSSISFLPVPSILFLVSSFKTTTRKIVSLRNNPFEDIKNLSFVYKFLFFFVKNFFDILVVQTNDLKKDIENKFPNKKVIKINNLYPIYEKKKLLNKDIYLKKNSFFLFVGKMSFQKGLDLLLNAYEIYSSSVEKKNLRNLYIISNSTNINYNYFLKIKKLINKSIFKENIKLFFDIKNLEQFYKNCSKFVLTSRYEGFPNALMEAKFYKCSIVAFDCDYGPKEILKNYKNKIIIRNFCINKLSSALKKKDVLKIKNNKKIENNEFNKKIIKKWNSII